MVTFWESVTRPLLQAAHARVIVEIGASRGESTAKLLEFASEHDCVVHSIDPEPQPDFDPAELARTHGESLVFHQKRSLEALPHINDVDAAIIDGDHNWYTVYNELKLLAKRAAEQQRLFPLALLHDVGWPYGRRDLYYNPDTIPEEHRQPFSQAGLIPGQPDLADDGGLNIGASNAVFENTPRNGVRTAIEDFVAEAELPLHFQNVVGDHGLGILVACEQLEQNEDLRRQLDEFESPEWLRKQCERIELSRLWTVWQLSDARKGIPGDGP